MEVLRVRRPGILSTIQDLGRFGLGHLGVPRSGAADSRSARIVNRLVGNEESAAVLEMTASGAELEVLAETLLAFGGAPMPAALDGVPCQAWRSYRARAGQTLSFGNAAAGWRTYLAVGGGIDVPPVLGSRSTHLAAGFGGLKGRRLAAGDVLGCGESAGNASRFAGGSEPRASGRGDVVTLRVVAGPQAGDFPPDSTRAFYDSTFEVLPESNRAGLRLAGGTLAPADPPEIESEGVVLGSVQVPPGGAPIILLGEGPVTGGYSKISAVIAADLPLAGQLRPRDRVRFAAVSGEDARAFYRDSERVFEALEDE